MFDVDEFVAACRDALTDVQSALAVKEVVECAVAQPDEIDRALSVASKGGMRSLHHSHDLTIIQFVWPPGVVLFPHDHRMWAANGIYGGSEDNTFYRRTDHGIAETGGKEFGPGHVALLGSEVIHGVANPHRSYTAALHVYGGDFFGTPRSQWSHGTTEEEPFDVEVVKKLLDDADARARATG
jgi:predicted metal-dependent enzyme (double-stranded beta helix superfamily)